MSTCFKSCGNRLTELFLGEQCDDGGNLAGDGCSADCKAEAGWKCSVGSTGISECLPAGNACGNGQLQPQLGEECDDGNTVSGDGCSSTCRREVAPVRDCGNGRLETALGEQCDDGNSRKSDGCSSECRIEFGWRCPFNVEGYRSGCEKIPRNPEDNRPEESFCGNGEVEAGEECDDGYLTNGDGCSVLCVIEAGWNCSSRYVQRGISYCQRDRQ